MLEYASDELQDDVEVVLLAIKPATLTKAERSDASGRNDKREGDGNVLEFASDRLQNSSHVVMEAVKQNGQALKFASEKLAGEGAVYSVHYCGCDKSGMYPIKG